MMLWLLLLVAATLFPLASAAPPSPLPIPLHRRDDSNSSGLELTIMDDLTDAEIDAFDALFVRRDECSESARLKSLNALKRVWRRMKMLLRRSLTIGIVLRKTDKQSNNQRRQSMERLRHELPRIVYIDRLFLTRDDETLMLAHDSKLSSSF